MKNEDGSRGEFCTVLCLLERKELFHSCSDNNNNNTYYKMVM